MNYLTPVMLASMRSMGIREPVPEHRFHPVRKWRLDWAWPDAKVYVEIEGGVFSRGAHARGLGIMRDMEKQNAAVLLGWKPLRFTPKEVKNLTCLPTIKELLDDVSQAR